MNSIPPSSPIHGINCQTSQHSHPSEHSQPSNVFLCTICRDTPDELSRVILPHCSHTFCLKCILTWHSVRPACPNCTTPFSTILTHTSVDNKTLQGPRCHDGELPWALVTVEQVLEEGWVKTVPLKSRQEDLQDAFVLPAREIRHEGVIGEGAVWYRDEEVEDEIEEGFWRDEEEQYERLVRGRVLSNRRFGANGYISAGRMAARRNGSASAARTEGVKLNRYEEAAMRRKKKEGSAGASGSSTGGRKKKLKKKSRQGIALAKKKEEEEKRKAAAAAASSAGGTVEHAERTGIVVGSSSRAGPSN